MSGAGDGTPSGRRMSVGEIAALVSAATAVVGLLLAMFGVPLIGGSPSGNRPTTAGGAAAASAAPDRSASTAPPTDPTAASSALPSGWRRVDAPDLRAAFALPDSWTQDVDSDIQSNWSSPDENHAMSLKRDLSYGSTPKAAGAGQLKWYRDTSVSRMADLKVVTHPTRQNGKDALWLEIDYHWAGQDEPRKRVELFVAGKAGHVYQLLFDTAATPGKLATQKQLFATARAHLLIDQSVRPT
ncbi:hypothetical protein [Streptomyces sp. NPDC048581]|uniref:hypothetical protein n=1 Tax=unclassified Streptomyces TaxID=2593676 RepID=UPI0037189DCC